jgi:peptidoglycan hydrolase-like protein with peptidoglycan-binding domain
VVTALGLALVWTSLSLAVPVAPADVTRTEAIAVRTAVHDDHQRSTNATPNNTPLTRGDRGPRVADLQRALIAAGMSVRGGADGIFGPATLQALTTFQTSVGLRPSGVVDVTTAHLLGLGPAPELPRRGDRGDSVATLQRALIDAGVTVRGGADGVFGAATEKAVAAFQTSAGLSANGRVDVTTAIALGVAPQGATTVNTNTQNSSAPSASTGAPAVSGSTTAFPRRGQTGDAVAVLQRALIAAGVTVRGGADGVFGAATEAALKVYQHEVRRSATGVLDEITAQLLGLVPGPTPPRRGDRGESVAMIQRGLLSHGVAVRGGADGVFGVATETAIATFQGAQGLSATGRLDLVTYFLITAPASSSSTNPSVDSDATSSTTGGTSTTGNTSPIVPVVFPVQGPCWFTDTWHAPRPGGRRHLGVDIIAPSGKAVYAVTDGIITRTFTDRPGSLGGNALRLTASDGTYFHYAHFSSFADGIELGREVVAGQIIGYVGSTGNSSTPHLHFEYHPFGGTAVNPYPLVKTIDACTAVDLLPQPEASSA